MNASWRRELPHLLVIVAMFVVGALLWPHTPDKILVHWNLQGEVDRFGGKLEGLFAIPAITLAMYGLLLGLPLVDPRRENYEQFRKPYAIIRWSLTIFLAVIYGVILLSTFGWELDVGLIVSLMVGALFVVLGNYMGKLRPNWFAGVRTPWTLSSKLSWNRTHRAAGWTFILMGLCIALTGVLKTAWALIATLVLVFVGTLGLVVYSYLVWRDDPAREPALTTKESSVRPVT